MIQMSCSDESLGPDIGIAPEVKPMLESFIKEASARNVLIDTTNIEVVFVDQLSSNVVGACGLGFFNYNETGINRVEILLNSECWQNRNQLEKENLFFHELGHALLGRFHSEEQLPNGSKKSLMCGACNNFNVYESSTEFKRNYYLDELFDETVSTPDWATRKTVKSTLLNDNFDGEDFNWDFVTTDGPTNQNNYEGRVVDSEFVSSPNSLLISAQRIDDSHASAFWRYTLDDLNIPALANVTLSSQIRAESLQGVGANIALVGYDGSQGTDDIVVYRSSFETRNILGSQSFSKYELSILCFPENVDRLEIHFQIQPNTIGTVYLDDVELVVTR